MRMSTALVSNLFVLGTSTDASGTPYHCVYAQDASEYDGGSHDIKSCQYAVDSGFLPSGTSCNGKCEAPSVVQEDGSDLNRPLHIKVIQSLTSSADKYYLSSKDDGTDVELLEHPSDRSAWRIHSTSGRFQFENVRGASSGERYLTVPWDGSYPDWRQVQLNNASGCTYGSGESFECFNHWDFRRVEAGKYVIQNRKAFDSSDSHRRRRRGSILSLNTDDTIVVTDSLQSWTPSHSASSIWMLELADGGDVTV